MYQHIMVPLDGSVLAECVLPHVEALVKGGQAQNITLVRVVEYLPLSGNESGLTVTEWHRIAAEEQSAAENYLQQMVSQLNYQGVEVRTEVLNGAVAPSLADYAEKSNVDLIVVATHGRSGISRWVWGSVADRVIRSARVPVLVVRGPGCVPGI